MVEHAGGPGAAAEVEKTGAGTEGWFASEVARKLEGEPVGQGEHAPESLERLGAVVSQPGELSGGHHEDGTVSGGAVEEVAVVVVERGSLKDGAEVCVGSRVQDVGVGVEEDD